MKMKTLVSAVALSIAAMSGAVSAEDTNNSIVLKNVRIFDGMNEKVITGKEVLVENNLITKIGDNLSQTPGVEVIDGGGKTLMPGIMDMHVHMALYRPVGVMRDELTPLEVGALGAARMENMLMSGFTTVRDTCGASDHLRRVSEKWNAVKGPRIISAEACITQTGGHGDFRQRADVNPNMYAGSTHMMETTTSYLADGPTEIRRAVRENMRNGASFIKIMATGGISSQFDPLHQIAYTPEEIQAAVETAETYGTYVTVHGIAPAGTINAINNGVKMVEHGAGLDEETVKLMKKNDVWLVPSLFVLLGLTDEDARKLLDKASYVKWKATKDGLEGAIKLAVKYDIKMAYGTDFVAPADSALASDRSSLVEFEYWARFLEPWQILRLATGNAGELAALSGKNLPYQEGGLGQVKAGYYADMIIVDGDPTKDISLMTNPDNFDLIMKDGIIYKNEL
ncbi:amidohydrolase family protein [Vibrio breoganii]